MARVVQTLIETMFNTLIYNWTGKIYKQMRQGPLGLRPSGFLAKAAIEAKLKRLGMNFYLMSHK